MSSNRLVNDSNNTQLKQARNCVNPDLSKNLNVHIMEVLEELSSGIMLNLLWSIYNSIHFDALKSDTKEIIYL